ncbi:alpha-L-glutamate ligase-like protein [Botrimarina hoheduenensis]|uniref:Ribosomal protein S6--L-glutamate ligase n=1 Tax=Botrimarina hoheduenensis TaxID=2528000 RepID=A0A5C5VYK7_9BACT|nr:alpha-L-glutamate ligase-like protein [Botrimarina hoheduenensis]TWT42839.1 Ribosomal protein S6--L-glutamate ligase [Botrimarina hoheduenensis]
MQRFFASPSDLRASGILGINRRNLSYIIDSNPRGLYPRVDNKLITKTICEANGIPVPETYNVLTSHGDVKRFPEAIRGRNDFVVKPARGAAGRGVLVIGESVGNLYITPGGRRVTVSDLRYHLSAVLSGLYSLGGGMDAAIVEHRIVTHPVLQSVAIEGTPDIRVILYRCVPVMAMVRLPTTASGGRANLHQGAIAAAVDMTTGRTFGGVSKGRMVDVHPDTEVSISGIEIPSWDQLLDASMRLAEALELGYIGVDFVVDAEKGPVVLEANARPGLAIQVAHRRGIRPALERVAAATPDELHGKGRLALIAEITDEARRHARRREGL